MQVAALSNKRIASRNRPPGPKGLPLLGSLPEVARDVLGFFPDARESTEMSPASGWGYGRRFC